MNIVQVMLDVTLLGSEWVLWLLLVLSVFSVSIMVERGVYFSRMRINFPVFMADLQKRLVNRDVNGLREVCAKSTALECQIVLRGLEYQSKGTTVMRETMHGWLICERSYLDRGLMVLGTLGNNAPFIGLFGTVLGIIQAFHQLSVNPAGGPSVVMSGISEALVATAVGLMVAIPAVIAFNGYQRIIRKHMANAEAVMKTVIAHLGE